MTEAHAKEMQTLTRQHAEEIRSVQEYMEDEIKELKAMHVIKTQELERRLALSRVSSDKDLALSREAIQQCLAKHALEKRSIEEDKEAVQRELERARHMIAHLETEKQSLDLQNAHSIRELERRIQEQEQRMEEQIAEAKALHLSQTRALEKQLAMSRESLEEDQAQHAYEKRLWEEDKERLQYELDKGRRVQIHMEKELELGGMLLTDATRQLKLSNGWELRQHATGQAVSSPASPHKGGRSPRSPTSFSTPRLHPTGQTAISVPASPASTSSPRASLEKRSSPLGTFIQKCEDWQASLRTP